MPLSLSLHAKSQVDEILTTAVKENRFSAIAFGAASADGTLHFSSAGRQNFDDVNSTEINSDSVFWICSQTKLVTSIAVLQLIDKGLLTLTTPIAEIIPELRNPIVLDGQNTDGSQAYRPAKVAITVAHLLNHTSGLADISYNTIGPLYGLSDLYIARYEKDQGEAKFFRMLKGSYPSVPLKFEPGTDFAYGPSCDILGFIVQRLSGEDLETYFKKNIFGPLRMDSTSFYLTPELKKRLVRLTYRLKDGSIEGWKGQLHIMEQDPEQVNIHLGGVGLFGSEKDYLTMLQHLLQIHAGVAENPILTTQSVNRLFDHSITADTAIETLDAFVDWSPHVKGCQWGSGLCVHMHDTPGGRRKGTGTWGGWANTFFFLDPTSGVAAVIATQLLPPCDNDLVTTWKKLEDVLYAGLEGNAL